MVLLEQEDLLSVEDLLFVEGNNLQENWPRRSCLDEELLYLSPFEQESENVTLTEGCDTWGSGLFQSRNAPEFVQNCPCTSGNFQKNDTTPSDYASSSQSEHRGWAPTTDELVQQCLKTDVHGRQHYHGLYALDAIEKSLDASLGNFWSGGATFSVLEGFSTMGRKPEVKMTCPKGRQFDIVSPLSKNGGSIGPLSAYGAGSYHEHIIDSRPERFLDKERNAVLLPKHVEGMEHSSRNSDLESTIDSTTSTTSSVQETSSRRGRKFRVLDPELSPSLESQIKRRPQRKKQYSRISPAKFCHLCARATSRSVRMVVCANINIGMCLKVTCEKCFQQYQWNFAEAIANPSTWVCTHCRGSCPDRAQCSIYQRTNHRRRINRFLLRQQKISS
eukprot:jgi/Galph1/1080/GphlegSOOS_G5907.1